MGPMNLCTKFMNWSLMRWSVIGNSLIWYSVHQAWLDHFLSLLNEDKIGHGNLWAIKWLPQLMPCHLLIITWFFFYQSDHDWCSAAIPMCQFQCHPCWSQRLEHVKFPELSTGVCDTKTANHSTVGDPSPFISVAGLLASQLQQGTAAARSAQCSVQCLYR